MPPAPKKTMMNRVYTREPEFESIPAVDLKGHTVEELAAAANVSVDVIQKAIFERQKKLEEEYWANYTRTSSTSSTTRRTTTTTTERPTTQLLQKKPPKKYYATNLSGHKVRT